MLRQKLYRASLFGYCVLFITIQQPARELRLSNHAFNESGKAISKESEINNAQTVALNVNAVSFVKKYLKEYHLTLVTAKKRSGSVFPIMDAVFEKYNLPVQLKYLAVVESDLETDVKSDVGAAGIWQLMPLAAKTLGLKMTNGCDERYRVYKSTVGAARYLKQLHDEFGDWLLAIAAYNAGAGRIHHAMKMAHSRDFWLIQNYLPLETRNHVKRFIGVHYYFEGQGSVATMTKAEVQQYANKMTEFIAVNSVASAIVKNVVSEP